MRCGVEAGQGLRCGSKVGDKELGGCWMLHPVTVQGLGRYSTAKFLLLASRLLQCWWGDSHGFCAISGGFLQLSWSSFPSCPSMASPKLWQIRSVLPWEVDVGLEGAEGAECRLWRAGEESPAAVWGWISETGWRGEIITDHQTQHSYTLPLQPFQPSLPSQTLPLQPVASSCSDSISQKPQEHTDSFVDFSGCL